MPTPLTIAALTALAPLIDHETWHWTAGSWTQTFAHYHFCIVFDVKTGKARAVQTRSITEPGAHVYKRNTGNIGISLCGMGRIAGKLHAIQEPQIEVAAKLTAELAHLLSIQLADVHDHAHWATTDGYGPGSGHRETRVDVGTYEPILRAKTAWYLDQLKTGKAKREHTLALY